MADDLALDFDPLDTLGFVVSDWIEAHCKVPSGVYEGEGLEFNGWQLFSTANHYRIKPAAVVDPTRLLRPFHYRRSVIVGPQKCGKSPWGAGILLAEGVGPTLFAGWASGGERYRCVDYGCHCGWEYEYLPGEAMGMPRRKSLLGLLAFAETQTQNVYEPMQTMIHNGPLGEFVHVREGFIRLPNRGKIVPLSSAAKSKLGQPLTGALGDESGLYTASNKVLDTWQTMRRGVAAMQGRTVELTNPWDPMENSAAQQAFESREDDIFRYYRKPPADLSYANKRERHKIHVHVYRDSPWVDPATIDAEANELVATDPVQAERFFGNRLVQGLGSFMPDALWDATESARIVEPGTPITVGFDGSQTNDWTAIRAETLDGHRFTPLYGPDDRPTHWNPAEWPAGRIPLSEIHAAVDSIFDRYNVQRMYCDPHLFESQIDEWAERHGEDRVVKWPTNSATRMYPALTRYVEDSANGLTTHDLDPQARAHAMNARRAAKTLSGYADAYLINKPSEHQKIDILMADVLAHEAAADARAVAPVSAKVTIHTARSKPKGGRNAVVASRGPADFRSTQG